jgi:putative membrane protein
MDANLPHQNKATEYLANERTFLAWVRTSISIVGLGFVVAKFGVWMRELAVRLAPGSHIPSTGISLPIGISIMAFGGLLVTFAAWHYHLVNKAIDKEGVTANRGLVVAVTIAVILLAALIIAYMVMTSEQL